MTPYHFEGQDRVLEAPRGHDHRRDGEISGLPVQIVRDKHGDAIGFASVWKPSPEDLEKLNAGGGVVFGVLGGQPPCWADTCAAEVLKVPA